MFRAELQQTLAEHLAWWGLERVHSADAYDRWQRHAIPPQDLLTLNRLIEERRTLRTAESDIAFYDASARPDLLPVLYSQRYDYYIAIGPLIAERLGGAGSVLDFGCGPGILTTFYARSFPFVRFIGVDRSPGSIAVARERADRLNLSNVRFECSDLEGKSVDDRVDAIVASHALLQAEHDPGLPSIGWWTFDRSETLSLQRQFEMLTGLGYRLDRFAERLAVDGRLILFEKVRQLGRRVPFQRALAARGFGLVEPPLPIRYLSVDEPTEDGPLVVVSRTGVSPHLEWYEDPEWINGDDLQTSLGKTAEQLWSRLPDRTSDHRMTVRDPRHGVIAFERGHWGSCFGYLHVKSRSASGLITGHREAVGRLGADSSVVQAVLSRPAHVTVGSEAAVQPLYENHSAWAQLTWSLMPERRVLKEVTRDGGDGRQMHVELGQSQSVRYLYCANTFDQRQLVVVEAERTDVLEHYYDEITASSTPEGQR